MNVKQPPGGDLTNHPTPPLAAVTVQSPPAGNAASPSAQARPGGAVPAAPGTVPAAPGDRVPEFSGGRPAAVLIWAAWSRPAVLERRLLEEVLATGSALAGRVRLIALDLDSSADAGPIAALGGAPTVPALYLLASDGVVRRRYFGWPARNPTGIRAVLTRELTALAAR